MRFLGFYLGAFLAAFLLTLVLTPLVRELNRHLGMVDKPGARRINKIPIPRGGGLALFLGVIVTSSSFMFFGCASFFPPSAAVFLKLTALAATLVAVGYIDDKFGLKPVVKLLCQLLVALGAWGWAGVGFADVWPSLPWYLDCAITCFWIAGAINAFNLIDGLDGLASGIALIATIGICGTRFVSGLPQGLLPYFALAGGLLGFLRYNYNPASVFLGDSGSMFIGFALAVLPLCVHESNSLFVSVGVPLLAMGIPIFDTSLAILRRSVRHLLRREGVPEGNGEVMTADTDHLHHRILRAHGFNQRKAVWILYALAFFLTAAAFLNVAFASHEAGLWLITFTVCVVIACRDMARVEIFDFSLLLSNIARREDESPAKGVSRLAVPFYICLDLALIAAIYLFCVRVLQIDIASHGGRLSIVIRVAAMFVAVALSGTYVTVWSRALLSNFLRLALGCAAGALVGSFLVTLLPDTGGLDLAHLLAMTLLFGFLSFAALTLTRLARPIIRDVFFLIDARRIWDRKDVSRVLVYGSGLRYRAFRREMVRRTTANRRVIVGILDDNPLLLHHYIGSTKVMGSFKDAPSVINALNVDAVVIAFEATEDRVAEIVRELKPLGVKVSHFSFSETDVSLDY